MIRLGETWSQGKRLGTSVLVRVGNVWMTIRTAIAFLRMAGAAAEAGHFLTLNSGWRSWAEQAQLYQDFVEGRRKAVVAKPGHSNHQNGIALDIDVDSESTPRYRWLAQNAHKFGFKRTVASEPWHWEYRPEEISNVS